MFVSEYWIFEYEYQKFDFSNIFVLVFGPKINIRPTLAGGYNLNDLFD